MPNAIFIDTSNLNVLFKVGNRFSLGVNYASAPEKIAIDAQALGTAFDVYLSIWPRQRGECDDCVNALSVGGVPFIVIPEEVDAALKLVEKIPGVGTIYVCNALANFVKQARVANFQSVIPYGRRFALVTVKNSMLEDLRIYDTQDELYAEQGEGFTCYGDLDLIDIDGLKAQYDELTPFDKSSLSLSRIWLHPIVLRTTLRMISYGRNSTSESMRTRGTSRNRRLLHRSRSRLSLRGSP